MSEGSQSSRSWWFSPKRLQLQLTVGEFQVLLLFRSQEQGGGLEHSPNSQLELMKPLGWGPNVFMELKEPISHASPPGTFLNDAATEPLRLDERADACTNGVVDSHLSPPSQWIPCGQCVGCHNTVNCGQCANCKHGTQSPESRRRLCRKRKCICPVRKVGGRTPDRHVRTLLRQLSTLLIDPTGFWERKFPPADELRQS